jgi:DNA-binding NtrC family response regulator
MRDPLPHVLVVDDDASILEALDAALGHAYLKFLGRECEFPL